MSISLPTNHSYAPQHPGVPILFNNAKLNVNLSQLYSHAGQQLGINEEGCLHVLNNVPTPLPNSPVVNYVNNLFGSFGGLGFDSNKQATLFDVNAKDVRQCTVQTINNALEIMQGKSQDSTIALLDTDASIGLVPQEIRRALEILYFNGVTPFTYEQLTDLLKGDITAMNIPTPLKNELIKLKNALAKFDGFTPTQKFYEVDISAVNQEKISLCYEILKNMDSSLLAFKSEFSGFIYDMNSQTTSNETTSNSNMETTSTSNVKNVKKNSILEALEKLSNELTASGYGNSSKKEVDPEINALLNVNIEALKNLSPSTKKALTELKNLLPKRHSIKKHVEIIDLKASIEMKYDKEFRQLDRNGWLYISKKINKLAEDAFSNSLRARYVQQLFAPWVEINKGIVNGFIENELTRSFMDDPACREISKDTFARKLANLFSMNGVNMDENFPELATCYAKLKNRKVQE